MALDCSSRWTAGSIPRPPRGRAPPAPTCSSPGTPCSTSPTPARRSRRCELRSQGLGRSAEAGACRPVLERCGPGPETLPMTQLTPTLRLGLVLDSPLCRFEGTLVRDTFRPTAGDRPEADRAG